MICECVHIQHDRLRISALQCPREGTHICSACNQRLCGGCGKRHHTPGEYDIRGKHVVRYLKPEER